MLPDSDLQALPEEWGAAAGFGGGYPSKHVDLWGRCGRGSGIPLQKISKNCASNRTAGDGRGAKMDRGCPKRGLLQGVESNSTWFLLKPDGSNAIVQHAQADRIRI